MATQKSKDFTVKGFTFSPEVVKKMLSGWVNTCPLCEEGKEKKYLLCVKCFKIKGARESLKQLLHMQRLGWNQSHYNKKFRAFVRAFYVQEERGYPFFSEELWEAGFQYIREGYSTEIPFDILRGMSIEAFHAHKRERLYELARQYLWEYRALVDPQRLTGDFLERYKLEVSPDLVDKTFQRVLKNSGNRLREEIFEECLQVARQHMQQNPKENKSPGQLARDFAEVDKYGDAPNFPFLHRAFKEVMQEIRSQKVREELEGDQVRT